MNRTEGDGCEVVPYCEICCVSRVAVKGYNTIYVHKRYLCTIRVCKKISKIHESTIHSLANNILLYVTRHLCPINMSLATMTSAASSTSTLKSSQLAAVTRMLSLSQGGDASSSSSSSSSSSNGASPYDYEKPRNDGDSGGGGNPWKILIYDRHTRGIISPLLSVSQLRSLGVTLHLLLHSDREPIPDVPAVYFVQPTEENLSVIARDCSRRMYLRSHLHFSTRMERPVMEEFARLVVNTGGLDAVASVHDQFVEFACLEDRLFTLNVGGSYVVYNDPGATGGDMEMAMNGIAAGLFSVVATMGSVPVIRCPRVSALSLGRRASSIFRRELDPHSPRLTSPPPPRAHSLLLSSSDTSNQGGAPEMVARKLNRLITDHPTLVRSKDGRQTTHHRPVLVIMDRNMDLITPVQHASTYQALIDDVLEHRANRVEFNVKPDPNDERGGGGEGEEGPPRRQEEVRHRPRPRPVLQPPQVPTLPGGDREQRRRAAGRHREGAADTLQDGGEGPVGRGRRGRGGRLVGTGQRGGIPPHPPRAQEEARGAHVHPSGRDERGRRQGRAAVLRAGGVPRHRHVQERPGEGEEGRDGIGLRLDEGERQRQGPSRDRVRPLDQGEERRHRRGRTGHEGIPRDEGIGGGGGGR